jgi:hypothetical protein
MSGVVGSAFREGASNADCGDYFGGISGLGDFCGGGEDVWESVAGDWNGDSCVCRWVVSGGGREYVFWRGAGGICVLGGVADIFGDFPGAGDCGGGGLEVVALEEKKLSSAAEVTLLRVELCQG